VDSQIERAGNRRRFVAALAISMRFSMPLIAVALENKVIFDPFCR
jgi:hypothetical protein